MLANFLSIVSLATLVASHGVITNFIVDGKGHSGPAASPNANNMPSPIRQVSSFDPNYGATSPNVTCGPRPRFASQIATVNPGSTIGFGWFTGNQEVPPFLLPPPDAALIFFL